MARNSLGRFGQRKVEDLLSAQWEQIEQHRPTQDDWAQEASKTLGFPISKGNVIGCMKAIDRSWPSPKKSRRTSHGSRFSVEMLAVALHEIDAMAQEIGYNTTPAFRDALENVSRIVNTLRRAAASVPLAHVDSSNGR
jgi:hypothetical protein